MMRTVVAALLLSLSATADAFAPTFGARLAATPRGAISRPSMRPRVALGLRMIEEDNTALSEFVRDGKVDTLTLTI